MSDVSNVAVPAESAPVQESSPVSNDQAEAAAQEAINEASAEASQESAEKAAEEKKEEIKKNIKKLKLKVDGEEIEEEIDLDNEKELVERLQLAKAAKKRMQKTAEMEKQVDQLINLLRNDPLKILSHPDIGVDVKALAQKVINQELEEAQKTPEQKEKERLQKELEELKSKQKEEEERRQAEEMKRLQDEQEERITNDVRAALESVKLPYSPRAVKYMAEYMSLALQNGYDISAKDVAPLVLKEMKRDYQELLRNSSDDVLEEFIDKDLYSRVQKKRLSKMKKPVETANSIKPTADSVKPKESKESEKKLTIKDFFGV